jgi:hypothetical protein
VSVDAVDLEISGVAARAMLKVRLQNVFAILDRALTSLDRNPQLVEGVLNTVDDTVEGVAHTVPAMTGRARMARRVRALTRPRPRLGRLPALATAAGLLGGAAVAAHGNGRIERTIKELTS